MVFGFLAAAFLTSAAVVGIFTIAMPRYKTKAKPKQEKRELSNYVEDCFIANKTTSRYHFCGCGKAERIFEENREYYYSIADAQKKGYIPAGCCNPDRQRDY